MYPTYPSPKFRIITASASAFTYPGVETPASRAIYASSAGDVTIKNDAGESVVIPFSANLTLPVVTRYMTATTVGGTVVALF